MRLHNFSCCLLINLSSLFYKVPIEAVFHFLFVFFLLICSVLMNSITGLNFNEWSNFFFPFLVTAFVYGVR